MRELAASQRCESIPTAAPLRRVGFTRVHEPVGTNGAMGNGVGAMGAPEGAEEVTVAGPTPPATRAERMLNTLRDPYIGTNGAMGNGVGAAREPMGGATTDGQRHRGRAGIRGERFF